MLLHSRAIALILCRRWNGFVSAAHCAAQNQRILRLVQKLLIKPALGSMPMVIARYGDRGIGWVAGDGAKV
ncbi:hypothetical protein [Ferrovibrio sp.]|uniref:hypothetical protein n=1 Tax=Ferrovibrio sp. TaxID=1917215 RepID=UPI003D2AD3CC